MYLLDSSAIAVLVGRLGRKALNYLRDIYTLDLVRYELGNVIWKEHTIRASISSSEAISRAGYVAKLLETMKIWGIRSDEDFKGTMSIALKLKLTFYDASYLYLAIKEDLTLVTEDEEFREKSKSSGIKAIAVNDYVKRRSHSISRCS